MKWIRAFEDPLTVEQELDRLMAAGTVMTIGNFDGVHKGHRNLLQELVNISKNTSLISAVMTFRPHPRVVLNPQLPFYRLFDHKDQYERLKDLGIDLLIEKKFSLDLANMTADDFFKKIILEQFNAKALVVGYDFSFGKSREGNLDFLRRKCQESEVVLKIVNPFEINGQIVSSSYIRRLLQHGEVETIETFLGRKYYLRGIVQRGFQRGRQIGVPTANIDPDISFVPRRGVYFSQALVDGRLFNSITNIGFNPTFQKRNPDQADQLKVECHLLDCNEDLYDQHLQVELIHFWRDEMRFSSIEKLTEQISLDLGAVREYFDRKKE